MTGTLLLGLDIPDTRRLADSLGAEMVTPDALRDADGWSWSFAEDIERYATRLASVAPSDRVVVCTWTDDAPAQPLLEVDTEGWMRGVERPFALWYAAIAAGADRCTDGGAIAVVVERPAFVDSTAHVTTCAVGEAILSITRSVALVHGERGVRINAVATEITTAPPTQLGHHAALSSFPGTVEHEVAGAVRMVLSADGCGVTGTVVVANGGRQ